MALFTNPEGEEQPQKNQYLTSNPNTNPSANTSWMSPTGNTGFNPGSIAQSQPNPLSQVQNGTMLGSIASGATHDFNPATGLSREQYRDAWMSSGVSNPQQMQDWIAKNGGTILNAGSGVVETPYGDRLDMGQAFKSGFGKPAWTDVGLGGSANGSQMNQSGGMLGGNVPGMAGGGFTGGMNLGQLLQMLMGNNGGGQSRPMEQTSSYFQNMPQQPSSNPSLIEGFLNPGKYAGDWKPQGYLSA